MRYACSNRYITYYLVMTSQFLQIYDIMPGESVLIHHMFVNPFALSFKCIFKHDGMRCAYSTRYITYYLEMTCQFLQIYDIMLGESVLIHHMFVNPFALSFKCIFKHDGMRCAYSTRYITYYLEMTCQFLKIYDIMPGESVLIHHLFFNPYALSF